MSPNAVAMAVIIAAVFFLSSCQPRPSMSHASFCHLPASGWQRSAPLTFYPEYDDSAATYDIVLAIRHDNTYPYSNLSLAVDFIAEDSTVTRQQVEMTLADDYGNWTGGGFGALYQDSRQIASVIDPGDACAVVVWQTMNACDTLRGLVNVGIITSPYN